MKKIVVFVIIAPLLLYFLHFLMKENVEQKKVDQSYFGRYRQNGSIFLRGQVEDINGKDRILTIRTSGDSLEDIAVPEGALYFFKLKPELGGEMKSLNGDYFNNLKKGDLLNVDLAPETVFASRILVYDLEKFSF